MIELEYALPRTTELYYGVPPPKPILPVLSWSRPAIFTNSATELAFIFCIT